MTGNIRELPGQTDRYVHDRLPPRDQWPKLLLEPELEGDLPLNCIDYLLSRHVERPQAARVAVASNLISWSYAELHTKVNRIADVFVHDFGLEAGNRVLLRGPNSPMLVALWLATQKIGAIAVTTMSLLRHVELSKIIDISKPALAVSDLHIAAELSHALDAAGWRDCRLMVYADEGGELEERMGRHSGTTETFQTRSDDISLIGFTSGTTGVPKATIHFHRDVLSVCRCLCEDIIRPRVDDVFIGTSPLAFTFGLGAMVFFPLYAGATSVLNARYTPESFIDAIRRHRATVCFTVPTFYQRMSRIADRHALRTLRLAISSGEALPLPVREAWHANTGLPVTEVMGSTEMLHAFVGATDDDIRPGRIGRALTGYRVAILDIASERHLPRGEIGRLAVIGPTGCRYLADDRQKDYVEHGWNITGDACSMDDEGYVEYHARIDDLIISSGYNISGVEVENVLLEHPDVLECAVIGTADTERGAVVTACIVPRQSPDDADSLATTLQDYVRANMAPYKYPRRVIFLSRLPRNESGKLQRFRLREQLP